MFEKAEAELLRIVEETRVRLNALEDEQQALTRTLHQAQDALTALAPERIEEEVAGEENTPSEHTGKYRKLYTHLCNYQGPEPLRMTFSAVEDILGFSLPPSSRRHLPHWYGYEGSAVARAIRDAGWKASRVNLEDETVEFRKYHSQGTVW